MDEKSKHQVKKSDGKKNNYERQECLEKMSNKREYYTHRGKTRREAELRGRVKE